MMLRCKGLRYLVELYSVPRTGLNVVGLSFLQPRAMKLG